MASVVDAAALASQLQTLQAQVPSTTTARRTGQTRRAAECCSARVHEGQHEGLDRRSWEALMNARRSRVFWEPPPRQGSVCAAAGISSGAWAGWGPHCDSVRSPQLLRCADRAAVDQRERRPDGDFCAWHDTEHVHSASEHPRHMPCSAVWTWVTIAGLGFEGFAPLPRHR